MARVEVHTEQAALVRRSIDRYRRAHRRYERRHPEIFNEVEQARLREALGQAKAAIRTGRETPRALDFGCGAGNLSHHLLELGFEVTAADVSPDFLRMVRRRFAGRPITTVALNGLDLAGIPDRAFDLVATYSVLHHVPDYVGILDELVRVTMGGGALHLDHEANEEFWGPDGSGHRFREALAVRARERRAAWNPQRHRWQRPLQPSWLAMRFRPQWVFGREGDIHVWPHDHIEWERIEARLTSLDCEVVRRDDYLNFHAGYPRDLWAKWRDDGGSDMRCLLARRR